MKKRTAVLSTLLLMMLFFANAMEARLQYTVTVNQAGTLRQECQELIKQSIEAFDLTVVGPINEKDFNILNNYAQGRMVSLDLSQTQIEENKIPDHAFTFLFEFDGIRAWTPCMRKVVLPEGLEEIGEFAFKDNTSIVEIVLPSTVKKIGDYAFAGCTGLTSIELPQGMETIDAGCFSGCTSLKSINLPSTLKKIRRHAFDGSGLQSVDFPVGLKTIDKNAFSNTDLTRVEIPESCIHLREAAFENDSLLTEAIVPPSVEIIPVACFRNCVSLEKFEIAEGITIVDAFAFENCTSLRELKFAESVKQYNQRAFYNHAMEELIIPEYFITEERGVMVGIKGLFGAKPLKRIYSMTKAAAPYFNYYDAYDDEYPLGLNTASRDLPIYIQPGTKDAYIHGLGWPKFTNFIETEEFPAAGISDAQSDGCAVSVKAENGAISISGADGTFEVFGTDGRLIHSGNCNGGTASVKVVPGLYIVKAADLVKKVKI